MGGVRAGGMVTDGGSGTQPPPACGLPPPAPPPSPPPLCSDVGFDPVLARLIYDYEGGLTRASGEAEASVSTVENVRRCPVEAEPEGKRGGGSESTAIRNGLENEEKEEEQEEGVDAFFSPERAATLPGAEAKRELSAVVVDRGFGADGDRKGRVTTLKGGQGGEMEMDVPDGEWRR